MQNDKVNSLKINFNCKNQKSFIKTFLPNFSLEFNNENQNSNLDLKTKNMFVKHTGRIFKIFIGGVV